MGDCGNKVPCGCGDSALTTQPSCSDSEACVGEACSELFCESCIARCDATLAYKTTSGSDALLTIEKNERLSITLQKILIAMRSTDCLEAVPVNFAISAFGSTEATFTWNAPYAGIQYLIRHIEGNTTVTSAPLTADITTTTITGLTADTEYRVELINVDTPECSSVSIIFKTKA